MAANVHKQTSIVSSEMDEDNPYPIKILHDFGYLQIQCTYARRRMYSLVAGDEHITWIDEEDIPRLVAAIQASIADPGGEKRDAARQGVVDVMGAICFQAEYNRACIIQQITEIADAVSYELEYEDGSVAEEISDDTPFF